MKVYQLAPERDSEWLLPAQVAEAFASNFFAVDVDAQAAARLGERFLLKYRQLLDVGCGSKRSTPIEEIEHQWSGAVCLTVKIDEEHDALMKTVALNDAPLELEFSDTVSRRRHRAIAQRATDALGYKLLVLDADGIATLPSRIVISQCASMGYDYSNHHVFVGKRDAGEVRQAVVDKICSLRGNLTKDECAADRSIVVGPPGRWIFVGDSAGSTETPDPEAFDGLACQLSRIAPTISIKMSDSAIVHILLYADGRLVDKFGNGTFPWFRFTSPDEAQPFRGELENWTHLLVSPTQADALRTAWSHDGDVTSIVERTARLFGMHADLIQTGYSVFDEDIEIKYDEWLCDASVDMTQFDEFHLIVP